MVPKKKHTQIMEATLGVTLRDGGSGNAVPPVLKPCECRLPAVMVQTRSLLWRPALKSQVNQKHEFFGISLELIPRHVEMRTTVKTKLAAVQVCQY